MEIHSLNPFCRWLSEPKFLLQPEDQWPIQQIGNIPVNDKEIRVGSHVTLISLGSALDLFLRRYSSWLRLQTLMAWLLRFVEYIKNKNALPKPRGIGIVETQNSMQKIAKLVQRHHFPGVDFFWSFYVKRGRASEKVYGFLSHVLPVVPFIPKT